MRCECTVVSCAVSVAIIAVGLSFVAPEFNRWETIDLAAVHSGDAAVLVTGATSGIGLSAAEDLSRRGFTVFAGCRKEKDLERFRAKGLESILLDVTNSEHVDAAVKTIRASGKKLVAVVNNAGATAKRPIETAPLESVRRVFDVNYFGAFEVTQKMLPLLREATAGGHGARIVFVGSVSGIVSLKLGGVYSGTKYALESLADSLRLELAPWNIAVSMVNPGYINTEFRHRGNEELQEETLSPLDREFYGDLFEDQRAKVVKRAAFAEECCESTDNAIADAIVSETPRTRYYPAVVAPNVPAWLVTPVIHFFQLYPSMEPLADYVKSNYF